MSYVDIQCLQYGHLMLQKNTHNVCRSKDCVKKFFKSLEEHAEEIINFEKEKMISLTDGEFESFGRQKYAIFADTKLKKKMLMIKNIVKLDLIAIIQLNTEMLFIAYVIQDIVCLKKFQ